jgi:acyl-CoA dehydrogenase
MDFAYDERTEELRTALTDFMHGHVFPAEEAFERTSPHQSFSWERPAIMAELKAEARRRGLWNLFLPHGPDGAGLSVQQYAPLAEITGWSPSIAPEALNCAAPDTGNMELLEMFAGEEQRVRWLRPLLDGEIRSAFCMTEPDVASSDANNISTRLIPDGDGGWRLSGRKWWSTGVMSSDCALLVVMAKSHPDADRHERHSMVLVPRDRDGVEVVRGLSIMGRYDETHGGHGEVRFHDVRVDEADFLGAPGAGFRLAQARLGPGRIHHCMRLIGMAERALALMCVRAGDRVAFGKTLAEHGSVLADIADARVRIDQLRQLILRTAWLIDTVGARKAATEISEIKIAAPAVAEWVIERAIQVHGAAGLTTDFPLAGLWAQARGLRFADGPEEVHRMVLGRREVARQLAGRQRTDTLS